MFPDKIRTVPLLRALVPLVAGIIAGWFLRLPFYVWGIGALVCGVMAWRGRKRDLSTVYIHFLLFFFGAADISAHVPLEVIPKGERVWLEVQVTDNPTYRAGRSGQLSAVVNRWRADTPNGGQASAAAVEWQRSREKLLVRFDTVYNFTAGDRMVFRGYVNAVSDSANSYGRLMRARGYTGRTYIGHYSRVVVAPERSNTLSARLHRFQEWATARLFRLRLPADEGAVAAAMTTGDRRRLSPELRAAYSRTGASHLLAVSGLHVGIVFLLVNALLYLLPLFRRGHVVKNLAAVAIIWIYAAMAGLSPSVIRAALMFTGAQIALATSSYRSGVNIMCGTALVMLAVDPAWLFDISFQLSFIAVAAIIAWFGPLYRLVAGRWRVLNAVWGVLVVSFVASAATMPLVSHTFGTFSPAGILLNPVIVVTAHLVVMFSLVWIMLPLPFLEPLFRWLAGGPAWLQNRIVGVGSELPFWTVEQRLSSAWVFAIYAAMIIFTAWMASRAPKEEPFTLPR